MSLESRLREVGSAAAEETRHLEPRLLIARGLGHLLPDLVGNRVRAWALRWAGVRVGPGTVIGGALRLVGSSAPSKNLLIGRDCWINAGCHFDASHEIRVGDRVSIAQQVMLLTETHEVGPSGQRAGALTSAPIVIGDGCWLGARCIVLPGVTIGRGAVVAAGSVVTKDVEPNTLVAGVPARVVRRLEDE